MAGVPTRPVVHLELHTGNLARACAFYGLVCGWRPQRVDERCGSYWELGMGGGLGGGVVECETAKPVWLPYVEVADVDAATEAAGRLGAAVLLAPREGPGGWRSVVEQPDGGELGFWQPKERRPR